MWHGYAVKIPKQINHWAECSGLKHVGQRCRWYWRPSDWYGHGRRWRINSDGLLQCGAKDFDRWANSVACSCSLPRSLVGFAGAVWALQAEAEFIGE